jgi:O-antigen/teichoic acid export membrane protein
MYLLVLVRLRSIEVKSKLRNFSKRPFIRNVIIMATGTAAAQAITLALSPIITRLYGPENYGVLGVFMAIVGLFAPIVALTYPIAIVLPKSNSEAKGLVRLSVYLTCLVTAIVLVILLCFNQPIIKLFQIEVIEPYIYLIPLFILFAGFLQVVEQWLIRTKQFSITARVTFINALIVQGSKVGFGLFYPVAGVLIIFNVFGQALKALMMIFGLKKTKLNKSNNEVISISDLAKKHVDFPLYRAPQTFVNAISQSIPMLMLTSFFGPASVGFYSIGRTVLSIPTELIGKSVGDVFYPRISEAAYNGESLTKLIKKATISLAAVGIIPFGIIVAFGPWLFSLIFGAEWVVAGEYARWIALWLYCSFINQPSLKAIPALSEQKLQLKYGIVSLILRIIALAIGYYVFSSDVIAIALFGLTGAVRSFHLIVLIIRKSKQFDASNNIN